jgi:hypothetical protein
MPACPQPAAPCLRFYSEPSVMPSFFAPLSQCPSANSTLLRASNKDFRSVFPDGGAHAVNGSFVLAEDFANNVLADNDRPPSQPDSYHIFNWRFRSTVAVCTARFVTACRS